MLTKKLRKLPALLLPALLLPLWLAVAAPADAQPAGAPAETPAAQTPVAPAAAESAPATEAAPATPPAEPSLRIGETLAPAAAAETREALANLDGLIAALNDPEQRAELVSKLQALSAASEPAGEDAAASAAVGIVNRLDRELDQRERVLRQTFDAVIGSWRQVPFFVEWARAELADPERRELRLAILARLALLFAIAFVARSLARRLWPVPMPAASRSVALQLFGRDVLAAVAFGLAAVAVLGFLRQPLPVERAGFNLTVGLTACFVLFACTDLLFGGRSAEGRLVPAGDRTAGVARRTLKRLSAVGVVGYFALQAARVIGLPWTIHGFFLHLLFFYVTAGLIVLIFRSRAPVSEVLRAWGTRDNGLSRALPWRFFANYWHWAAALAVALHYLIWALKVPDGFTYLFRATLLTAAVLAAARLASRLLDRTVAPPEAERDDQAALDDPAAPGDGAPHGIKRFSGPIRLLLRFLIALFTVIGLLEVWQVGLINWIDEATGRSTLYLLLRVAAVVAAVIFLLELSSRMFNRHISALDAEGRPLHSNRSRTLASIFKNVSAALVVLMGTLFLLVELGVDPTPLLAGAGVIGLAIGFGSQKLVQDLITGLFILLGDLVRVGDVVEVGGKAGVIEGLSMRTVTLRAYDGNVHVVPYSSIDIVTNMTKEFSFAVLDVPVSRGEDVDEVLEALREIGASLRDSWPFRRLILAPLEIAGLDAIGESNMLVRIRIKTVAGEQWTIKRELLRRIKLGFDSRGIEIPYPHRTLYLGDSAGAKAPPEAVEGLARELRQQQEVYNQPDTRGRPLKARA